MGDFFVGEIRLFPYNRIPRGWMVCEGQLLNVQQNAALFSLLSFQYGGDGKITFAIPDLRGKVPISAGVSTVTPSTRYNVADTGGESTHTLTINEIPLHQHNLAASSTTANQKSPVGNVWASQNNVFAPPSTTPQNMHPNALANTGNNNPHNNMQPFTTFCFCISTTGIYPSRP